jgi:hypothetical protein
MFVLQTLLFIGEGSAMRGLLALLHPFSGMQGMRQGCPFLLGFLQEGINQLNSFMEFHGCAPWY